MHKVSPGNYVEELTGRIAGFPRKKNSLSDQRAPCVELADNKRDAQYKREQSSQLYS